MGEQEYKTEDCGKSEKTEFTVLSSAQKLVEGPEILRDWHDSYEECCEKYEDST
jgi:hypothetical protein